MTPRKTPPPVNASSQPNARARGAAISHTKSIDGAPLDLAALARQVIAEWQGRDFDKNKMAEGLVDLIPEGREREALHILAPEFMRLKIGRTGTLPDHGVDDTHQDSVRQGPTPGTGHVRGDNQSASAGAGQNVDNSRGVRLSRLYHRAGYRMTINIAPGIWRPLLECNRAQLMVQIERYDHELAAIGVRRDQLQALVDLLLDDDMLVKDLPDSKIRKIIGNDD